MEVGGGKSRMKTKDRTLWWECRKRCYRYEEDKEEQVEEKTCRTPIIGVSATATNGRKETTSSLTIPSWAKLRNFQHKTLQLTLLRHFIDSERDSMQDSRWNEALLCYIMLIHRWSYSISWMFLRSMRHNNQTRRAFLLDAYKCALQGAFGMGIAYPFVRHTSPRLTPFLN